MSHKVKAARWSLTGDTARCAYALATGGKIVGTVSGFRTAREILPEMRWAGTFEEFLRRNGIEIID
jgi:hypothetical protein